MAENFRTLYLRHEKILQKHWEYFKNDTSQIEKILKNGVKSINDKLLVEIILKYILTKQDLEKFDKMLLEKEMR